MQHIFAWSSQVRPLQQPPPPKVDLRKAALFNEVLKKVDPDAEPEAEPEAAEVADAAEAGAADVAPAPKAKARAKKK